MHQPPPLTKFTQFPATAGIGLMAIGVTTAGMTGKNVDVLHMNVLAFEGEPWRIVTSAFPHGGVIHLLFNIFWLWAFGTALEQTWGPIRTLAIFVVFEVGSGLAEYALFHGGIGLSGIGYGLFGLLAVLSHRDRRFAGVVTRSTINLFVFWFFLCIVITYAGIMPVGNVSHAVGAIMGLLLGIALTTKGVARIASAAALPILVGGALGAATLWRPIVNFSEAGGADSAKLGYDAYTAGKFADAIPPLRRAVEVSPRDAGSWYNLGLSLERTGDPAGALAAFRRAYAIQPSDTQFKAQLAAHLLTAASTSALTGDHARAIPLAREAYTLEPTDDAATLLAAVLMNAAGNEPKHAIAYYVEVLSVRYNPIAYDGLVAALVPPPPPTPCPATSVDRSAVSGTLNISTFGGKTTHNALGAIDPDLRVSIYAGAVLPAGRSELRARRDSKDVDRPVVVELYIATRAFDATSGAVVIEKVKPELVGYLEDVEFRERTEDYSYVSGGCTTHAKRIDFVYRPKLN